MKRFGIEVELLARRGGKGRYKLVSYCKQPDCVGRRRCRECRNVYSRATRVPYSELPEDVKRRSNCRAYTKVLQSRGVLPKGPCEGCGFEFAQNHHHWGYDLPRWYIRLCKSCHGALEQHLRADPKNTKIPEKDADFS